MGISRLVLQNLEMGRRDLPDFNFLVMNTSNYRSIRPVLLRARSGAPENSGS